MLLMWNTKYSKRNFVIAIPLGVPSLPAGEQTGCGDLKGKDVAFLIVEESPSWEYSINLYLEWQERLYRNLRAPIEDMNYWQSVEIHKHNSSALSCFLLGIF